MRNRAANRGRTDNQAPGDLKEWAALSEKVQANLFSVMTTFYKSNTFSLFKKCK